MNKRWLFATGQAGWVLLVSVWIGIILSGCNFIPVTPGTGLVSPPTTDQVTGAPGLVTRLPTEPGAMPTPVSGQTAEIFQVSTPGLLLVKPGETRAPGTPSALVSPPITATLTQTATPHPYAGLSIDELSARAYGGGLIETQEILAVNSYFTRTLITYPSDQLTIYGFMNTPRQPPKAVGENNLLPPIPEKFPVVIALHGYIEPSIYNTLDYTTRYADALARAGFLVIHPNLRGYPPSDEGDNLFRVGMAIDVLNLISIIKEQAGKPGPLENADAQAIGIWGHSMGGGISTRVITISPDIRAAVLYGAMSADDQKNFERIYSYFSNGTRGVDELQASGDVFAQVSPVNYLDRVQAKVSIHHGKNDPDVPLSWSLDLCRQLQELDKLVECYTYPGQGHTFQGDSDVLFIQRMIDFFRQHLLNY